MLGVSMGRIATALATLTGRSDRSADMATWEAILRDRGWSPPAGTRVDHETALRHSGVWAALRLRANLMSILPPVGYRNINGRAVEVDLPELFTTPFPGAFPALSFSDWRWGACWDKDRYGTSIGIIHSTDGVGKPAVIEPVSMSECSIIVNGRTIKEVRVNSESIPLNAVWLETRYRPSGHALGLSAIQAAAWSIGGYLSAQKFGLKWFDEDRPIPKGTLRNTERAIPDPRHAQAIKAQFRASVSGGDIFVTGKDWEWTSEKVDVQSAGFIDMYQWGITDVARFLDVPSDLIDAAVSGSSVTYANITQRNLQLLVMSLSAPIHSDDVLFSAALPRPWYVRFNSGALLRMDEETRHRILGGRIKARTLTPNEAREIDDLPPLTPEQIQEFAELFPYRPTDKPSKLSQWEAPS